LILLLESGLFGTFTALNFFHWFLFWELSLIPAFFLIKLWGGEGAARLRRSSSSTPWSARWRCCWHFWRSFRDRQHGF
jgi:NADH:ubiquinone oxidoreductase subunit 5 (subunit L)/multisubunit Na+/H+ antiporter MnhA subunit